MKCRTDSHANTRRDTVTILQEIYNRGNNHEQIYYPFTPCISLVIVSFCLKLQKTKFFYIFTSIKIYLVVLYFLDGTSCDLTLELTIKLLPPLQTLFLNLILPFIICHPCHQAQAVLVLHHAPLLMQVSQQRPAPKMWNAQT